MGGGLGHNVPINCISLIFGGGWGGVEKIPPHPQNRGKMINKHPMIIMEMMKHA